MKNNMLKSGRTKIKSQALILWIVFLLATNFAKAQESTNSSGGDATGSGGSVAFSVGQVVYTTTTNPAGIVAQGVQQPFEISIVGLNEAATNISLTAFPNPTADNLTLQLSDFKTEKLSYQIYDLQGKQLNSQPIVAPQTTIEMKSLPNSTYFIYVVNQENKKVQSFKILKK
jgi:hypothetical protein